MDKFLVRAAVREAENFFALVVPLMNGSLDTEPLLFPLEPGIYPCSSQTSKLATKALIIHVPRMLCIHYTVHIRSYAWPTGRLAQRLGLARYALCIRIGRAHGRNYEKPFPPKRVPKPYACKSERTRMVLARIMAGTAYHRYRARAHGRNAPHAMDTALHTACIQQYSESVKHAVCLRALNLRCAKCRSAVRGRQARIGCL